MSSNQVDKERFVEIEVDRIDKHPKNPRIHFTQAEMQRLMESIDEQGVLVPILVYPNGDRFILVDGERRWRSAKELGLKSIPAVVTEPQTEREHLIQMFNIHMVREPWNNMPTAWALERLIKELGTDDDKTLREASGLGVDQIKRLKHALDLPKDYQKYIDDGSIPLNFFWELHRHVIEPLAKRRPALWEEFEENEVLKAFVDKRLQGTLTDTVSLRKVNPIIRVAEEEAGAPEDPSPLDETIVDLIRNTSTTIDDAYEDSVEVVVEADRLEKKSTRLMKSFERLWSKASTEEERDTLAAIASDMRTELERITGA